MSTFGLRLREILDSKKIPLDDCRIALGLTRTGFYELMTGRARLTEQKAEMLAWFLKIEKNFWLELQELCEKKDAQSE